MRTKTVQKYFTVHFRFNFKPFENRVVRSIIRRTEIFFKYMYDY